MPGPKPKQRTLAALARDIKYVVVVDHGPKGLAVYGTYRSFVRAEGDAKAWNGTVEPLMLPEHRY